MDDWKFDQRDPEAEKGGMMDLEEGEGFFFEGSSTRNLSIAAIPGRDKLHSIWSCVVR